MIQRRLECEAVLEFTIPYPPTKKGKSAFCRRFGLNAYYAGKHWAARKKDADELHILTISALRKAQIRKSVLTEPVRITFLWDDGLDVDNHAVLGKAIVDAMKGYLLVDDNRVHFKEVRHGFWDGGCIKVIVEEL